MARRKSDDCNINEEPEFNTLFGTFHASSVDEDSEPIFKIVAIGEEYAQPCRCCGEQPVIHVANFKDKEKHPHNVYISCPHCSYCDGNWYSDNESALAEWNRQNIGSKPRDRNKKDGYDIINEIMKDVKISD